MDLINIDIIKAWFDAYASKVLSLTIITIILFAVYTLITAYMKRTLLKHSTTDKHRHNVKLFMHLWGYMFYLALFLILIFYISGSFTALGISAGLFTAALGWALQRPITGMAAWIMVVIKKPFQIGDRIIIGGVTGDVEDISLSHTYLKEVGGTINSEENSGRIVMIPNSILFEQNIINYTMQDEFILDEVVTLITYESRLNTAMRLCKKSAEVCTKDWADKVPDTPQVRVAQKDSGIEVSVRYFVKARERLKTSSNINETIINEVAKHKDLEIAYPHLDLLYKKKPKTLQIKRYLKSKKR